MCKCNQSYLMLVVNIRNKTCACADLKYIIYKSEKMKL